MEKNIGGKRYNVAKKTIRLSQLPIFFCQMGKYRLIQNFQKFLLKNKSFPD